MAALHCNRGREAEPGASGAVSNSSWSQAGTLWLGAARALPALAGLPTVPRGPFLVLCSLFPGVSLLCVGLIKDPLKEPHTGSVVLSPLGNVGEPERVLRRGRGSKVCSPHAEDSCLPYSKKQGSAAPLVPSDPGPSGTHQVYCRDSSLQGSP